MILDQPRQLEADDFPPQSDGKRHSFFKVLPFFRQPPRARDTKPTIPDRPPFDNDFPGLERRRALSDEEGTYTYRYSLDDTISEASSTSEAPPRPLSPMPERAPIAAENRAPRRPWRRGPYRIMHRDLHAKQALTTVSHLPFSGLVTETGHRRGVSDSYAIDLSSQLHDPSDPLRRPPHPVPEIDDESTSGYDVSSLSGSESSDSDSLNNNLDEELYSAPPLSNRSGSNASSPRAPGVLSGAPARAGDRKGRSVSPIPRKAPQLQPHKYTRQWRLSSALSFLNSHFGSDRGPLAFDVDSHIGHRAHMEDAYSVVLDLTGVCPARLLRATDLFAPRVSLNSIEESCTIASSDDRPLLLMFAVFDGHGGSAAAEFAKTNFHRILSQQVQKTNHDIPVSLHQAMIETDVQFASHVQQQPFPAVPWSSGGPGVGSPHTAGTTATVVVANPSAGKFWTAHVGDSEAWLLSSQKATRLVRPHSPLRYDERRRIVTAGGMVSKQVITMTGRQIGRVNGVLSVSRAIGDAHLKQWVISTPEITEHKVSGDEEALVLASDGLWDTMDPDHVYSEIYRYFASRLDRAHRGRLRRRSSGQTPEGPLDIAVRLSRGCAKHLVNVALARGGSDNVTCIVVFFEGVGRLVNNLLSGGVRPYGKYRRHDLKRRVKSAFLRLFSGMDQRKPTHVSAPADLGVIPSEVDVDKVLNQFDVSTGGRRFIVSKS